MTSKHRHNYVFISFGGADKIDNMTTLDFRVIVEPLIQLTTEPFLLTWIDFSPSMDE